jgi:hypothetical protein
MPTYVDSPMAAEALQFYSSRPDELDPEMRPVQRGPMFDTHRLHVIKDTEESKALTRSSGPAIIISSSGMATGGRVLHHLKRLLPDPKNTVMFVGYQAAGTRGRLLVDGAQTVKIHGEIIPVAARIERNDQMSAHADHDEIPLTPEEAVELAGSLVPRSNQVDEWPDDADEYPPDDDPPPADTERRALSGPAMIATILNDAGIRDRGKKLAIVSRLLGREIGTTNDLTPAETSSVISELRAMPADEIAALVPAQPEPTPAPARTSAVTPPEEWTGDRWREFLKALQANPGAAIGSVLTPSEIANNPSLFGGSTLSDAFTALDRAVAGASREIRPAWMTAGSIKSLPSAASIPSLLKMPRLRAVAPLQVPQALPPIEFGEISRLSSAASAPPPTVVVQQPLGQDVRDRGIAHVATGGIGGVSRR